MMDSSHDMDNAAELLGGRWYSSDTAFAVPSASNSGDHTGKENGHGLTQLDQYALPGRAASSSTSTACTG
jgi:hypothetical protein